MTPHTDRIPHIAPGELEAQRQASIRAWESLMLARTPEAWAQLLQGEPVPKDQRDQLRPAATQKEASHVNEPHLEMFSLPPLEDVEYWEKNIAAGLHQPMSAEERAEIMAELDAERDLFAGLSHAQVLEMEFPEERMLVEDVVPIGAVGTIAGVPETYKSWQAQTIAVAVATGQGGIFGRPVLSQGSVGYFWQDDSTREEAERIKLFDSTRGDGTDIPVRWDLNEGLRLPEHLHRLKHTIVHNDHKLVVLDSFYNVLFGTNLKDEEAEQVITLLKSEDL